MKQKNLFLPLLILGITLAGLAYFYSRDPHKPLASSLAAKSREWLPASMDVVFKFFDFNQRNALSQWEDKAFKGRVKYELEFDHKNGFVHSVSRQTSSAIFYRVKFDLSDYPFLAWKWRVNKFPEKKSVTDPKKADDYAARVYVVFLSHFFTNYRCVEYAWDETLPEGTIIESPYSDKIKQIVIQSGPSTEEWASERRNVYDDYQKLFGEKPTMKVGAIALMTDSEGTETEAEGFFDDIQIGKHKIKLTAGDHESQTSETSKTSD